MNKKTLKIVTLILSCLLLIGAAIGITAAAADGDSPSVEIVNKNVAYEGAVQLVFALEPKNADGLTAKVVFTNGAVDVAVGDSASKTAGYVKNVVGSVVTNNSEYPLVYSNGIAAKMLRKEIIATPVLVDAEGVIEYVGSSVTYSPYIYSMNRFNNASSSEEQIELYKALLDYSAAVQQVLLPQDGGDVSVYGGWADEYYVYSVDGVTTTGRGINGAPVLEADRLNETQAFAGFFEDGEQVYEYGEGKTSSAWYQYTVRPGNSGNFTLSYVDRNTAFVDSLAAGKLYPGSSALNGTLKAPTAEGDDGVYSYISTETLADGSTNHFWTIEKTNTSGVHNLFFDVSDADNCNKSYSVEYDFRWGSADDIRDDQPLHFFFYVNKGLSTTQVPTIITNNAINDENGVNKGINLHGVDMYASEWHNIRYELDRGVNSKGAVGYIVKIYVDGQLIHTVDKDRDGKALIISPTFRFFFDTRYKGGNGELSDVNFDLDNIHIDYTAIDSDPVHVYGENANKNTLKTPATVTSRAVYYKSCNYCGVLSEETFEYGQYDNLAAGKLWSTVTPEGYGTSAPAANATGSYAYVTTDDEGNYVYRVERLSSSAGVNLNFRHGDVSGASKYVYDFDFRWNGTTDTTKTRLSLMDMYCATSEVKHTVNWRQLTNTIVHGDGSSYVNFAGLGVKFNEGEWHNVRVEFTAVKAEDGTLTGYTLKIYIDGAHKYTDNMTKPNATPYLRFYGSGTSSDPINSGSCFDIDNYRFTTDGGVHGGETTELPSNYSQATSATATAPATYYQSYACCPEILAFENPTFEYGDPDILVNGKLWDNITASQYSSTVPEAGSTGSRSYICVDEYGNYVLRTEKVGSNASNHINFKYSSLEKDVSKYVYEFDFRWNGVGEGETGTRLVNVDVNNTDYQKNDKTSPLHNYQLNWFQGESTIKYNSNGTSYINYASTGVGFSEGTWHNVRYEFITKYTADGAEDGYTGNLYIDHILIKTYDMVLGTTVPYITFSDQYGTRPKNSSYDIDNYYSYVMDKFDTAEEVDATITNAYNGADSVVTLVTDLDTNHWWVLNNVDELLRKHGLVANLATVAKNLYTDSSSYRNLNGTAVKVYRSFLDTGRWQITNHSLHHGSYVSVDESNNAYVDETKLYNYIVKSGELIRAAFPDQKVLTYAMTGNSAYQYTLDDKTVLSVSRDDEYALIGDNYIISRGWGGERDIGELVWNNISTWDLRNGNDENSISKNSEALASVVNNGQFAVIYNHYVYKTNAEGDVIDNTTYSNPKTSSSCVDYKVVDALYAEIAQYVKEGKLWCATFEDAGKYLREAETATVKAVVFDGAVYLRVTDEMDDSIYDHELTVRITLPEALASAPAVKVTQGDKVSYYAVVDGTVLVNVLPDGGDATIVAEADASNVVAKPEYDAESAPATPTVDTAAPAIPEVYTGEDPSSLGTNIVVGGGVYPFGTEKIAIINDATNGLVYQLSKGSTTATKVTINGNTSESADKFVVEADMKINSTSELYFGLLSGNTNVCHAYLYVSRNTIYTFDSCAKANSTTSGLSADKWFKLKLEYVNNADGTATTTISINGTKVIEAVTTSTSAPAAADVNKFFFQGGSALTGDVCFDNVKLYHETVTE